MRGRVLWGVLAVTLLALGLLTTSAAVYRLLFALVAVPLVGYAGSVLASRRVDGGVRLLTPFIQVGDIIEEEFTLRSLHWWPKLLLEVQHLSAPVRATGRVVTIWPYQQVTWVTRTRANNRGEYTYGRLEVASADPLGLFTRRRQVGRQQAALIFPPTVELPSFYVPSGQGWTEGLVRGHTFSPSPVAASIRDYVPGDASGHIHWPLTLRKGKLMVREFEREPSGPSDAIWVLLDLFAGVQAGEGPESTVEYGVTIAASVAKRFLDQGRTVGLVVSGQERTVIAAAEGPAQLGRLLQKLAVVQPGAVGTLTGATQVLAAELAPRSVVVIVSPASVPDVAAAVSLLTPRGAAVVPILLEAATFAGRAPAAGTAYRLPGSTVDTYVIHKGDELDRRLDYRFQGRDPTPAPQQRPLPR